MPLSAPVRKALTAYLEEYSELGEDDPLWVDQRGPLRDRTGVVKMLKKHAWHAETDEQMIRTFTKLISVMAAGIPLRQ
jgi:hypothetical protein